MEDDYSKSGFENGSSGEEIYIHYHELAYLSEVPTDNSFKILKTGRLNFTSASGKTNIDLIFIA